MCHVTKATIAGDFVQRKDKDGCAEVIRQHRWGGGVPFSSMSDSAFSRSHHIAFAATWHHSHFVKPQGLGADNRGNDWTRNPSWSQEILLLAVAGPCTGTIYAHKVAACLPAPQSSPQALH